MLEEATARVSEGTTLTCWVCVRFARAILRPKLAGCSSIIGKRIGIAFAIRRQRNNRTLRVWAHRSVSADAVSKAE